MGREISSEMLGRLPICLILSAAVLLFGISAFSTAEEQGARSVILISVDTLRADRLSCYGYRNLRTPGIDTMSQGGTLFWQAGAQVPLTLPSHVSLLTSTYPFVNGIEDNGQQLGPNAVTLATILKSRGYATAAFVGGFVLDRRFGLNQGFDFYDGSFDARRNAGKDPGDIKRPGEQVVRFARQWLERNSARPFFVFLHLYDLHTPYTLPPAPRRSQGPGYDAALSYVDLVLGDFWKYLAQRDLLKRTLVIFTSDHGEGLEEHGESTHGYFVYQSTMRVPLIFHWPMGTGAYPARLDEPVSLLDVAPTVLQFLGLPRPVQFQGRSLLGLLQRKAPAPEAEVYGESRYGRNHFGVSSLRSLRLGRYKYIEAPKPELYDLSKDPDETRNLYATDKSRALAYQERLAALRSRFQPQQSIKPAALSPEVVARLSSLGYVAINRSQSAPAESGLDPKDRIAEYEQYGRAIVLASSGRVAESSELLKKLLEKDPGLLDVRMSLGLNHQRQRRHAEALELFREVLRKDPLNVLAHFNLGVSYYEMRQADEAAKELEAALAIAPYYTRAEELLGTIWLQKKDYERAKSHFNHMLTVSPGDFPAHYNLGVIATLEGRWEESIRHLNEALQADPQSAETHNTLGSSFLRRGELERAREEFVEAIRLQPKFAWAYYNLGLVFRQQKKLGEAARAFRQALAADPTFRPARDALERLEDSN